MKRILALLLTLVLCLGLAACGGEESPVTDSTPSTEGKTDVAGTDSKPSDGTEDPDKTDKTYKYYTDEISHQIILGDVENLRLIVYDLNNVDTDWELMADEEPVWIWDPQTSEGCELGKTAIRGFSDTKVRMLDGRKVVIACNSAGWFGMIDYDTKETLWENVVKNGPHSIEMMPNGDLIMIGSGGSADGGEGSIYYYPLSVTDSTTPSSVVKLYSGHGIQWDPDQNMLWAVYGDGITAVKVENYGTKDAALKILDGIGAEFGSDDGSGHDLTPVAGQPTKYWVTAARSVWQFDTEELELTKVFSNSNAITDKAVKGIAHFADGTMVLAVAGLGGSRGQTTFDYSTYVLRFLNLYETSGKVTAIKVNSKDITFNTGEFYKVHSADPSYKP